MKKTLAIVLALVMVLAMVPAAFAASTTKTILDKNYDIKIDVTKDGTTLASPALKSVTGVKKISFEYDLNDLKATTADKWADDKHMALVTVDGFEVNATTANAVVTVNGKKLVDGTGIFGAKLAATAISFPIELPKTGINMTYEVIVELDDGTNLTREIAKITVSGANSATYKDERKASFSVSSKEGNAYIVGNTVYVDYEVAYIADELTFTFKNDAGALFSEVAYATSENLTTAITDKKLDDSKVKASVLLSATKIEDVKFTIETRNSKYVTPKFNIVARADVAKVDPKGIYFAESSKTIKIGESYTPVVMGVVTNLPVKADVAVTGTGAELSLINVIDKKTVYGLAAGTTYITATYTAGTKTYDASSMKITVLNEGFVGAPSGTQMFVTCRTLNVRAGAGTSYKIAGKLSRNTKVTVLETANGWSKIAFNGGTAYVSAKYLAK